MPRSALSIGVLPPALRPWLGAVMISFSGIWVRLADTEPVRAAFLRGAYAVPALVLLAVLARRPGRGPASMLLLAAVAGVFLGLDFVAWHASIGIIGAGLSTVLANLQVVFVGVAGVVLFRERPQVMFWLALPLVFVGVWLLSAVGRPLEPGGSVPIGVALGVLTAALYSVCLVLLRLARSRAPALGGVVMLLAATLGVTAATGAIAAPQGLAGPAGWPADGWLVLLALGSQVVGWLLVTSSIHHLPAAATSVALLLQPVLAMVWGGVLLGEPLGPPQLAGAAVVLVGVALAHRAVSGAVPAPEPQLGAP